jgi:hypothetical protein
MTTLGRRYIFATQLVQQHIPEPTDILRVVYKTEQPDVWKLRYSNGAQSGVITVKPDPSFHVYFELLEE